MDIVRYISELPRVARGKFLKQAHCCLAIYHGLSEKERLLCSRLLASPCHYLRLEKESLDEQHNLNSRYGVSNVGKTIDDAETRTSPAGPSSNSAASSFATTGSDARSTAEKLLSSMWKLGVLHIHGDLIALDDEFGDELFSALSGPVTVLEEVALGQEVKESSKKELMEFSKLQWERLMKPLLNMAHPKSETTRAPIDAQLLRTLEQAGLVNIGAAVTLLPEGYTFLLSDIPNQIWVLVRSLLSKEDLLARRTDGISFLIMIATALIPGAIYSTTSLSDYQQMLLERWESFGLIRLLSQPFQPSLGPIDDPTTPADQCAYFSVTPLARAILENSRDAVRIGDWSSGIIVESNFYIYCYTNSTIMIGLLELFSHVSVRLPNMCVARLTRQSVRSAFRKGIHASHIIQYLQSNRHQAYNAIQSTKASHGFNSRNSALSLAQALNTGNGSEDMEAMFPTSKISGLPEQVEDQLKLWEEERFRFQAESVVHWAFESGIDEPNWFYEVRQYAEDLAALVWSDEKTKSMAVKSHSQEAMVNFFQSLRN